MDAAMMECVPEADPHDGIEDRERGNEYDKRARDTVLEECEDTDRKRDIRRHRDSPTALASSSTVEGEENARGQKHPSHGRDRWQARLRHRVELANDELSLDLHPHHEEEHRHEAVVD